MMLSLRTPPGGKVRLRGAEGAVWRDEADSTKMKTCINWYYLVIE